MSSAVAARSENGHEFQQLTDPHRRELLVHCYRILGSLEDAEDALQETLLRAWRRLDSLKIETSLRAWLYKIATHVCLDMLDSRKLRSLPNVAGAPSDPNDPLPAANAEPIWLEPFPDAYLDDYRTNPEAHYETARCARLEGTGSSGPFGSVGSDDQQCAAACQSDP
jgi:RNA polymerase sigma-70 factor (ECF subfamily)